MRRSGEAPQDWRRSAAGLGHPPAPKRSAEGWDTHRWAKDWGRRIGTPTGGGGGRDGRFGTSCGFALARRRRGARACAIAAGGAFLESGRPCDGHGRGPVGARSGERAYPPGQGGGGSALATGDHQVEPRLRIAEPRWRCAASRGRRVVQASGGPLDVGDVLAQRHLKPWCRRRRADDLAGLDHERRHGFVEEFGVLFGLLQPGAAAKCVRPRRVRPPCRRGWD